MTYNYNGTSNISSKSRDYRCFKCGVQIYFTSKDVETPSGKPTKDPLTGKHKMLDPVTKEYHLCKSVDIESFEETEEYKQKLEQWKAKQHNDQGNGNTIATKSTDGTLTPYGVKDAIIEQVLSDIGQIKMDIISIKDALKFGASGSGEAES